MDSVIFSILPKKVQTNYALYHSPWSFPAVLEHKVKCFEAIMSLKVSKLPWNNPWKRFKQNCGDGEVKLCFKRRSISRNDNSKWGIFLRYKQW